MSPIAVWHDTAVPLLAATPVQAPLREALRLTAMGMVGIFVFMALFAVLIALLAWLFPAGEDGSSRPSPLGRLWRRRPTPPAGAP